MRNSLNCNMKTISNKRYQDTEQRLFSKKQENITWLLFCLIKIQKHRHQTSESRHRHIKQRKSTVKSLLDFGYYTYKLHDDRTIQVGKDLRRSSSPTC